MTAITSFTVYHKNPEAREVLGRGFVVGKVEQVTSFGYQGVLPNSQTPAFITENRIVIKYEVLWDNQRHVSPSLHVATDLEWEALTEEYLMINAADDEDENEDGEEETTGDEVVNKDAMALSDADEDFTNEVEVNAMSTDSFTTDNGLNAASV